MRIVCHNTEKQLKGCKNSTFLSILSCDKQIMRANSLFLL